jgi:hypothetical protein
VLDRNEYPNLFDPDRTAVVCNEPNSDAGEPVQPLFGLADRPVDPARIRSVVGRVAPRGRVRGLLRYTPVTVLLIVLLTHQVGCSRNTAITAGTRGIATVSSTTPPVMWRPAERPQAARRPGAHAAHRLVAVKRYSSSTPSRYALRRPQAMPAMPALRRAASVSSPAHVLPAAAPASSYTVPQPVLAAARESGGGEFGFER